MITDIDRGRALVLSDANPISQAEYMQMRRYWNKQRSLVEREGECEGGCREDCLITTANGKVVCKHTRQPCPWMDWEKRFLEWCNQVERTKDDDSDSNNQRQEGAVGSAAREHAAIDGVEARRNCERLLQLAESRDDDLGEYFEF